jgi:hypothetical protein
MHGVEIQPGELVNPKSNFRRQLRQQGGIFMAPGLFGHVVILVSILLQ